MKPKECGCYVLPDTMECGRCGSTKPIKVYKRRIPLVPRYYCKCDNCGTIGATKYDADGARSAWVYWNAIKRPDIGPERGYNAYIITMDGSRLGCNLTKEVVVEVLNELAKAEMIHKDPDTAWAVYDRIAIRLRDIRYIIVDDEKIDPKSKEEKE